MWYGYATMSEQIWKDAVGFPNYEISNTGYVRRKQTGKILKARALKYGHLYVNVRNSSGVIRSTYVHRIVAITFIGPPPTPKHQVAHWDGNATNNAVSNLRWVTPKENSEDMIRLGRSRRPRGENAGKAKLSNDQADIVRNTPELSAREWGRRLGVSHSVIINIRKGISYI